MPPEPLEDGASTSGLIRHVRACNNAELPGGRLRLLLGRVPVGWVQPDVAQVLVVAGGRTEAGSVALPDSDALGRAARVLADQGKFRWRGEAFDVRADGDGAVLGQMDRGALPVFGLWAHNVHLNGLVRRTGGLHVWVARRAAHKEIGPGKLDHLAAGGIPAGLTPEEALVKEAAEEAGVPPALSAGAVPVAVLSYVMQRPEGLRRETMHCYDLDLPEGFVPVAVDGEVDGFELWPARRVLDTVRQSEDFVYDVPLVLIDFLLRAGLVVGEEAMALRKALGASA